MAYTSTELLETLQILGVAFIVGVIAQYLRQKTDTTLENANIWWLSIAAGFSAMVSVGVLHEYTSLSPSFLVAMSGIAGWAGISVLSTLSKTFDQLLVRKLDLPKDTTASTTEEGVKQDDSTTTRMGSQSE